MILINIGSLAVEYCRLHPPLLLLTILCLLYLATVVAGRDVRLVSFLALQQHRGFTILPVTILTATAFAAHNNIIS